MTSPKTITISGIGEVIFERSRKAKYVNISVRPFNFIRVAVPVGIPINVAIEIAETKAGWIKNQIRKMKKTEQQYYDLIKNDEPIHRSDAKKKILNRLNELSRQHDIPFNKAYVRNQKSRWGSCSAKKNISLNIKIARLPDNLMDYVILHELAHIKHHDHSKNYWRELGRIAGNAKDLDKQLDQHRLLLILI